MYVWICSWMSGVVAFAIFSFPFTFSDQWSGGLLLICLGCSLFAQRWINLRWLCFFVLGVLYAAWRCHQTLALQLPVEQSNRLFNVEGTVLTVASDSHAGAVNKLYTFENISAADYAGKPFDFAKLNIRIYGDLSPREGQRCTFYARLRSPVGKRNPGSRNIERSFFQRQISAQGYVVEHPANYCVDESGRSALTALRAKLIAALDGLQLARESIAILKALLIAERGDISDTQWGVFRETGTSHLIAISGLHITLSAGLFFLVFRTSLLLMLAGRHSGLITDLSLFASIFGAFSYVALANFPLPAERALIMVILSVAGLLLRKPPVSYRGLTWAAFLLLLMNPATVMSLGFWMSFGAVSILVLMKSTRAGESWFTSSLRTHCFLSVGLLPITCMLTETLPLTAPLGNLVAVPVVSFIVMPLALTGAICASLDVEIYVVFWQTAAAVWELLWWLLNSLAIWSPDLSLGFQPNHWQIALAVLAVALMLVPIIPRRWFLIVACVSQLMFSRHEPVKADQFRLVVLDVGQGLAVIAQTANYVLVYDTGPSFGGYSAGKAVVLPALKAYGIKKIDRLIISHGDNDHAGGYAQLSRNFDIKDTMVSKEQIEIENATRCERGQAWSWDGVRFEILSPIGGSSGTENDLSCVLRIYSEHGSVLLPGDIERTTEQALLNNPDVVLKADVLLAPHHGSKTSSTLAFVARVKPKYVVFAAGFFNRFNFPHKEVFMRYKDAGANSLISSEYGAIEFMLDPDGIRVTHERTRRLKWKS